MKFSCGLKTHTEATNKTKQAVVKCINGIFTTARFYNTKLFGRNLTISPFPHNIHICKSDFLRLRGGTYAEAPVPSP